MDVPLKKNSSGKRPKKKRFQGKMYWKKSLSEKGNISFENVSPNKSSSAKKLPSAHKISETYENDVCVEFQEKTIADLLEEWKFAECRKLFFRSEQKHGLKYQRYIGDGDSKTFSSMAEKKPYGDSVSIEKIECVGHVQKRMGSRLRKLKALWGEKELSDGKIIGGKGRLTDAIISKLTTFYGNAIRANSHNVNEMRQAVWAMWAHTSSTDDEPKHWFCTKGKNNWCKYNVSVHNNTVNEFSHKNTLPKAVSEVIKPVFKDLSHLKLLRRCLGGKTQNANESLNSLIWKYSLKLIESGINVTKIAACEYNDGSKNRIYLMRALNLKINKTNILNCVNIDKVRKSTAKRQVSKTSFEARKAKKLKILKQIEQYKLAEGNIYAAGTF
ncbi:uncharacterized protein TNCV_4264501 [Trichonephila clavipes]|nr:uncharacterized protein TNCV_4264501 [Trichonephila clavipes]